MRAGTIVEMAPAEELFSAPKADYTRELLAMVPTLERIRGERLKSRDG
jgi:peptide/nickel transport system ATP-binding protein